MLHSCGQSCCSLGSRPKQLPTPDELKELGRFGNVGPEPKKPKSGPTPERSFKPRFSPYVLRHTCATLLLLLGVDLLTVSRRLRHKNITITARFYGHIKARDTTAAPGAFDRLFAVAQQ